MKLKDFLSKEGVVLTSIITFFLLLVIYYVPPLNRYWESGDNFRTFALIVFLVFLFYSAMGILLLVKTKLWVLKWESKGFGLFFVGGALLFLMPFLTAMDILPGGADFFGPIHIILLVLGIAICLVGMFLLFLDNGFFSIWFLGVLFLLILAGHEAFRVIVYTGHFGPYDTSLHYEALGILIASFVLFIAYEVKNVYIYYLVDEALELKEEKDYEGSLEILEKALKLDKRHITALNNKGNILFHLKQYDEARECYQMALDSNPDYERALDNMKVVNKKLGIKEAA